MKRKQFKFRLGVAGAVLAALFAAGITAHRVTADDNLSDIVDVSITYPVPDGTTLPLTVYSPGAQVPPSLPLGVRSLVELSPVPARGVALPVIQSVKTVLGGGLDPDTHQITGERQIVTDTLVNDFTVDKEYFGVVDAKNLQFESFARGTAPALFASAAIRTVVTIEQYYTTARTVSNIEESAGFDLDLTIRDSAEIDADGNLIPDATALLDAPLILFGANGNITFVLSLGDPAVVRGATVQEFQTDFPTVNGPISVVLSAPTLSAMQAEDAGLSLFDTARLIVTVSANPASTLDGPDGVDPLAEFDLTNGSADLPAPRNIFARMNIAVTSLVTPARDDRGAVAPTWSFLDELPGTLQTQLQLSGPGIAALLKDNVIVGFYTYDTTMQQDLENITVDGDETGWAETTGLSLANLDNADDAADTARVVTASNGDDTIVAASGNASAIWATNAAPRLGTAGGGGGGTCFIATAAYGTPLAGEIDALRAVRDRYLLRSGVGEAFVDTYYRLSPPIAREVAENALLRQTVRAALVPIVALSRLALHAPGLCLAIALSGMVAASALIRRRIRRA